MKIMEALAEMNQGKTVINEDRSVILYIEDPPSARLMMKYADVNDFDFGWIGPCDMTMQEMDEEDWTVTSEYHLTFMEAMRLMDSFDGGGHEAIVSCETNPKAMFRYRNGRFIMNIDGDETDEVAFTSAHIKSGWKMIE